MGESLMNPNLQNIFLINFPCSFMSGRVNLSNANWHIYSNRMLGSASVPENTFHTNMLPPLNLIEFISQYGTFTPSDTLLAVRDNQIRLTLFAVENGFVVFFFQISYLLVNFSLAL